MLEALVIIAIVVYVIERQVLGEPLRGKRVLRLPVILTVIGLIRLNSSGQPIQADDMAFLLVGALIALAIGTAQGAVMLVESRNGGLWGKMPLRGLWLWVALIGTRVALTAMASESGAQVAASTAPIVLLLGVNRLGQAAVVTRRAHAARIAFSPEKDSRAFLATRVEQVNSHLDALIPGPAVHPADDPTDSTDSTNQADPTNEAGQADRHDPAAHHTTGHDANVTYLSDLPPRPRPFADRAARAERRDARAARRYERRTARRRAR